MKSKAKLCARVGLLSALALILSYLESILPFNFGIPGIKLGLANLMTVIALYSLDSPSAASVSLIRILLTAILFGSPYSLLYSLAGGGLSFLGMVLGRHCSKLSVISVSAIGGVLHSLGQIGVALLFTKTPSILQVLSLLPIFGLLTGILIGILAQTALSYLVKRKK
jgi:heptaprenyl diphosphate synthase